MIAPPLVTDGYVGYMVRHVRSSGFKLAIVVGAPAGTVYQDGSDKIRIRVWRASSCQWTQPVLVERRELEALTDVERQERYGLIERARRVATERGGRNTSAKQISGFVSRAWS